MPIEVIGAGFGRTGTMSTYEALNQLGFPCYHMAEVFKDMPKGDHLAFWHEVGQSSPGTQHDWERVFADKRATVDFPAASVWKELIEAYPEAKVLLTEHPRGGDAWYESVYDTIYYGERYWQFKLLGKLLPPARRFIDMSRALVWQRALNGAMPDRARAVSEYERHLAEVKAAVPGDRLLVFQVNQGWEPLCEFLGVPVPDEPFPNVNKRAQFRRMIRTVQAGVVGTLTLLALAIGYGLAS